MRHHVAVLEEDLHRLAGLYDNPIDVVTHLLEDRADADHPHAQSGQLLAQGSCLVGRQQRGQGIAKLQRVESRGGGPVTYRDLADIRDQALEQRPGLFGRPVSGWNLLQRQDRLVTIDVVADELSQRPEGGRLLASNRKSGRSWRPDGSGSRASSCPSWDERLAGRRWSRGSILG